MRLRLEWTQKIDFEKVQIYHVVKVYPFDSQTPPKKLCEFRSTSRTCLETRVELLIDKLRKLKPLEVTYKEV